MEYAYQKKNMHGGNSIVPASKHAEGAKDGRIRAMRASCLLATMHILGGARR